ncbi:MAG: 3-isopropylmalate dehydratase large subunit [Bacillota bacterium]
MPAKPSGLTLTERILSRAAGREVRAGELIEVPVDLILANDITGPVAFKEFGRLGGVPVADPDRVVLVADHFVPNKDIASAELAKSLREFAAAHGIDKCYDPGRGGVEHALLPEAGLVGPGQVIIGGDSHTCTYGALGAFATGVGSTDVAAAMATGTAWFKVPETLRVTVTGPTGPWVGAKDLALAALARLGVEGANYMAVEYDGEAITTLSVEGRLTLCNLGIEMGAKNAIIAPDAKTAEYVAERTRAAGRGAGAAGRGAPTTDGLRADGLRADPDAVYAGSVAIDASTIEPMVALPHLPSNGRAAAKAGDVPIDQVVIGSCTNGRLEDLREAARVLRGRRVHPRVRCLIIPATQEVYLRAAREGLLEAFVEAGCAVSAPTCGPCLGGHMGVLASGERCVATTNRNFVGRMGHPSSEVYLAGPAVAAASAVAGRVADPREVVA